MPHTFFYLRVRKDSILETKSLNQQRGKQKDHVVNSKSTSAIVGGSDYSSEEVKSSNHQQTSRYPNQLQQKNLFSSQSLNVLTDLPNAEQQNLTLGVQVVKKLAWSGKIPQKKFPAKKLLVTSMSSLTVNSLVSERLKTDIKSSSGGLQANSQLSDIADIEVEGHDSEETLRDSEEIPVTALNGMRDAFERSVGVGGSVYDLEVATQDTIDLNFYFTLSKEGVTQYSHKSSQFTSLAQWHREHLLFHRISAIRLGSLASSSPRI